MFKRRPGRHPIDPILRRTSVIKVRVNTSELYQFRDLAQRCRISVSSLLHRAVFDALPQVIPQINLTAFGSLARMNANLTQLIEAIAKGQAPAVSSLDLNELNGLLLVIRQLLLGVNIEGRLSSRKGKI